MNLIGRTDGRTDETDAQTDETDAQTDETDAQTTLGVKRVTAAILPLLRPSPVGARIINVSSGLGGLRRLSNKYREEFKDRDQITEDRIEQFIQQYLGEVKNGTWESGGWQDAYVTYSNTKVALNGYTSVLAREVVRRSRSLPARPPSLSSSLLSSSQVALSLPHLPCDRSMERCSSSTRGHNNQHPEQLQKQFALNNTVVTSLAHELSTISTRGLLLCGGLRRRLHLALAHRRALLHRLAAAQRLHILALVHHAHGRGPQRVLHLLVRGPHLVPPKLQRRRRWLLLLRRRRPRGCTGSRA
jgi:hypothetical protein